MEEFVSREEFNSLKKTVNEIASMIREMYQQNNTSKEEHGCCECKKPKDTVYENAREKEQMEIEMYIRKRAKDFFDKWKKRYPNCPINFEDIKIEREKNGIVILSIMYCKGDVYNTTEANMVEKFHIDERNKMKNDLHKCEENHKCKCDKKTENEKLAEDYKNYSDYLKSLFTKEIQTPDNFDTIIEKLVTELAKRYYPYPIEWPNPRITWGTGNKPGDFDYRDFITCKF